MSHFSTIKTKLKNKPQLVEALELLQYEVKEDQELRVTGSHGIGHETVEAEVAIGTDIGLIDIVAVNLYPFKETVAKPDVTLEEAIENIDIGGPSMVRSAAKNHKDVAVLTNPGQYGIFLDALSGNISSVTVEQLRSQFAVEAFKHTAEYDATISDWMEGRVL